MEISWHADEGIVVVSLWHGSICRATFRLPVDEAPAVIQTLADVLGDAVTSGPPTSRPDRPTSLFAMGRERLKRHVTEIVALQERPEP